jgi:hypothetical protein
MPCSLLKVNRRFGWIYNLHLQNFGFYLLHAGFLLGLFFESKMDPDWELRYFLQPLQTYADKSPLNRLRLSYDTFFPINLSLIILPLDSK